MYVLIGIMLACIVLVYDFVMCTTDTYVLDMSRILVFIALVAFGPVVLIVVGLLAAIVCIGYVVSKILHRLEHFEIHIQK